MSTLIKNVNILDANNNLNISSIAISNGFISDVFTSEHSIYDDNYFETVIDGKNLNAVPGFIDVHSKADLMVLEDPNRYSAVSQGIVLEVLGQGGYSVAPISQKNYLMHSKYLNSSLGSIKQNWSWESLQKYLKLLHEKVSTNILYYAPYGTLRLEATLNPILTKSSMTALCYLFEKSLDEGAIGLSVSTSVSPSSLGWSNEEELTPLLRILSKREGILSVNLDGVEEPLVEIEKAFQLAKEYKLKLHISRLSINKDAEKIFSFFEKRKKDLDRLIVDISPYYERELSFKDFLPEVFIDLEYEEIFQKIKNKELLTLLADEFENKLKFYDDLKILNSKFNKYCGFENCLIKNISEYFNVEAKEILLELFKHAPNETTFIYDLCDKKMLSHFFKQTYVVPATKYFEDGNVLPDKYGTVFCFITEHSSKDLANVINKLYKIPSNFYSYKWDIKKGNQANIVLLDFEKVVSRSNYINPKAKNDGIVAVFNRGKEVFKEDTTKHVRNGRVLTWL